MTKPRLRNSPEAKRWLIVGAFQAGATEKHVARISGLSRTAVRNIILNYQRTGTPCIPKKIPNKIRQKLVVEYDENGNIINTDDEEEEEEEEEEQEQDQEIEPRIVKSRSSVFKKKKKSNKRKTTTSNGSTTSLTANVTTKDIINYAMDQMRIMDNNHIHISAQKLIEKEQHETEQHYHHYHSQAESSSSSSSSSNDPICIPQPSPQEESSSSWHNLLSPPHYPTTLTTTNQQQHVQQQQGKNKKKRVRLPPPSKYDQNIRGYELWTHDDDMVLLNHVLHHLHGGGWSELEVRYNGRHSARLCYDRWKHLKSLLLKGITDKPNTPW